MDKWLNKKSMTRSQEKTETISASTDKKRKLNYDEPSTSSPELKQKKILRKYCSEYLQIGFSWNGDEEHPRPQCVICGCILANESMRPNKLHRHIRTIQK
jgi:hypothetical protein